MQLWNTRAEFSCKRGTANVEVDALGVHDGEYQMTKHEYSNLGRGKCSAWCHTESSDDVEKQELEKISDEDDYSFNIAFSLLYFSVLVVLLQYNCSIFHHQRLHLILEI